MAEPLRPGTAAELKDLVASAAGEERALEIIGAGSKRALGRPVADAHLVTLDRLAGIGLYEPEELVMAAACGTPLAAIEARLTDNRQQLAFEPADYGPLLGGAPGRGTIGGVFACNLSGPRRIKAGAARDHLLGVQAVTGRGDLIKSGGRVVKNVTGYDLCKLLTGSFGRPVAGQHAVALDRLGGIGLYEPEELVMTAACGTPLAAVEARLAENRQQLAFEPADYGPLLGGAEGQGTIGGVFACNLSGPRRIKAGAARDHLLGVQAVTGRGDLIKSGGRVVKNVTGYDLCKLLTGSFGTLAIMTELTFKVLPAAPESCTLLLAGPPRAHAMAALRTSLGSANDVAGAACLPAATAARSSVAQVAAAGTDLALLRLEGLAPSVAYRADALERLLAPTGGRITRLEGAASAALWREIRDVRLLPDAAAVVWRVSTAPAAGPGLLAALERDRAPDWLADWGGGLLWLALADAGQDGGAAAIRAALEGPGGHATLVRGSPALRETVPVFQPQAPALARLTARVKDSFDPKRILNPGRMYTDL